MSWNLSTYSRFCSPTPPPLSRSSEILAKLEQSRGRAWGGREGHRHGANLEKAHSWVLTVPGHAGKHSPASACPPPPCPHHVWFLRDHNRHWRGPVKQEWHSLSSWLEAEATLRHFWTCWSCLLWCLQWQPHTVCCSGLGGSLLSSHFPVHERGTRIENWSSK